MRDVVVIGGGLSGLAAACELEKHNIKYTMIEVKRRLGGSIDSVQKGGFTFDSGPMCHAITDSVFFNNYLAQIGLHDATFPVDDGKIAFKDGTAALVDALSSKVTAPVMRRMAVSTLGYMEDEKRFAICMENGMVLDAGALIIASPARYAERMLYTLVPQAGFKLLDYAYDSVARISLGYTADFPMTAKQDDTITAIQKIEHQSRTPDDGVIMQATVRFEPAAAIPEDIIDNVIEITGWPSKYNAVHISHWAESDPVMYLDENHVGNINEIHDMLPDGVELIGSDYIATNSSPTIDQRIQQGIAAARHGV